MKSNDSWFSPIPKKKTLSRIVTDQITHALLSGQLAPGDYLPPESQLAQTLNVGKSSIREATKMLEAVGVVEIVKGHGCRIRTTIDADALNPLTYQLIFQNYNSGHEKLVEFRQIIEKAASCLAVDMITEEQIKELKKIHSQMIYNIDNNIDTLDLDIQFHTMIYSYTQNPFFECVGSAIMKLFRPSLTISNSDHSLAVLEHHSLIIKAFEHRNKTEMTDAITYAIQQWEHLSLNASSQK